MEKQEKTKSILPILMVLLLAGISIFQGNAQKPSYSYYDSLTYRLYLNEDWEALSDAGMSAIRQGHDGYYMQIRTGIALFNRGQYRRADKYLTKAWELSPNEVSGEYAYLAASWSGRHLKAGAIRENLPESVLRRLGITALPLIRSAGVSWAAFSPKIETVTGGVVPAGEDAGSRLSANRFSHYSASLSHRLTRNGVLSHEAGVLKKENDLYIGSSEFNEALRTDNYQSNQFNYYLRWDGSLGHNWSMSLFGNGLWFNFPGYYFEDGNMGNNRGRWRESTYNDFDFVAGAGLVKSFGLADLSVEVAGSSIGNDSQFQAAGAVLFYPFYNLNFYLGGRLLYNYSGSNSQILGGGTIGGRLTDFLWLEASGVMADEARFFHLQQGNMVFNGTELVNGMGGINAIILPWKGFKWYISWQKRGYTSYFISAQPGTEPQRPLDKDYKLISTSVLWTF